MAYISPQAKIVLKRKEIERRNLLEQEQGSSAVRQLRRSFMSPKDYQQGFQRYKTLAFTPQALPNQFKIRKKRGRYTPTIMASGHGGVGAYGAGGGGASYRRYKRSRSGYASGRANIEKVQIRKIVKAQAGVRELFPSGVWTTSGHMTPRGYQALTTRQNQLLTEKIKRKKKKKEFIGLSATPGLATGEGLGWKSQGPTGGGIR